MKKKNLHQLRHQAHKLFDQIWKKPPHGRGWMSRRTAYGNLQIWTKRKQKDAHIANLNKRECAELIERLLEMKFEFPDK